ncbi:MAG: ABC transporter substrate-binding protein [Pseudomonadota bacterium]
MTKKENQFMIDRLADAARHGGISRRSFMYHAMAAGMTATTATGLWTTSAKAQPKQGGTYRVAQHDGNTSDTHDPGVYQSNFDISMVHTIRSFLTMINPDGTLGPDLATEWTATPDAQNWTFKLNDRATFHSGAKVTANDVLASMNYHRGEASTSAAKALLATVTDIVDNGDNTVTFQLSGPNADLPWLMTDYHLCIVPANDDGTPNWQTGDGSGPYKLEELEFGVGARFSRHEGWHGEGAYFDEVVFTVVNDPNARQTALITGDADAASLLENKTLGLLARDSNIVVENVASGQCLTMPMHMDTAPFDIPEVRKALKLSINREELIEKIAFGAATIGNDFHHSPAQPYWPSDIPQQEYDPDQAKSLLASVGMEGLTVDLSTADSITTGAVDAGVLFAEQAKAAGININVVREPNDGYWSDVWLVKPWCMVLWGSRPTPDIMYTLAYSSGAAWNESRFENERFNELLNMAKGELDDSLRAEQYREMAMISRDDGGTVIPYFPNFVYARRANVQRGENVSPAWQMDGYRHASRWWFDS